MDQKKLDEFLDEATHTLNDLWKKFGGESMGENELYSLNDLLTEFFGDKLETED